MSISFHLFLKNIISNHSDAYSTSFYYSFGSNAYLTLIVSLVQRREMTAVIFSFLLRVRNRGIYGRGKNVVLYASITNPRHI